MKLVQHPRAATAPVIANVVDTLSKADVRQAQPPLISDWSDGLDRARSWSTITSTVHARYADRRQRQCPSPDDGSSHKHFRILILSPVRDLCAMQRAVPAGNSSDLTL